MLSWRTRPSRCFSGYAAYLLVALNLSFAAASPLVAQSVDASDSTVPAAPAPQTPPVPAQQATPPPQQNSAVTPGSNFAAAEASAASLASGPTPISGPGAVLTPILGNHLGSPYTNERLPFRVTVSLGEVYADNIFAQPKKEDDYITRLSAQGELQLGNLLAVDGNYFDLVYRPSLHIYALHPHENGVDQDVDAFYAHHFSRLTLSLEQIYTSIQSTNASVGGLVTADVYNTQAKADWLYSSKVEFVAGFRQYFVDYDVPGYTDSKEWSGDFYGLYHWDDKLSFGLGPRIGYLILDQAPDEHFQQILARTIYVYNQELTVQLAAGGEDREYQTSARSDTVNPIFEFMGVYAPNPDTNLVVNASRRFTPSYSFAGEDYLATNVNLTATQRFLRSYYIGLVAGYENDDYKFVAAGATGPTRIDNYFYVQPNLSWKPNPALDVAVFDRYEEDDSNIAIFAFDANQVGVSVTAIY